MLDDVAAYLVISPLAAVVALVLGVIGWGIGRTLAPVVLRRERSMGGRRVTE